MKYLVLITFLFAVLANLTGQTKFQKYIGGGNDIGISTQQTTDNGYIITGKTASYGAGNWDIYLIKTNSFGDTLWTKTFGGPGYETPSFVKQTVDKGFIITGSTWGFGLATYDIYVIKTDSLGNLVWSKTYGGPDTDNSSGVQQTSDLGFIIAGKYSISGGATNLYLIKTDINGDTLWTRNIGGAGSEYATSIQQCIDGGYIVTGSTNSFGPFGVYLVKTNSNGIPLWSKVYSLGGVAYSIQQTFDKGFILAGKSPPGFGAGYGDMYLIKTDSVGNMNWAKTYGGPSIDEGYSVNQTLDSGYIFSGFSYSFADSIPRVYIVKANKNGNLNWSNIYGKTTPVAGDFSVQQTNDKGYIFAGVNSISNNVYLIKMDSTGNSGCNQNSVLTSVNTATPNVASPLSLLYNVITTITTPATQVSFGGIITNLCNTVGIEEKENQNLISIYPNPTNELLTVNLKSNCSTYKIELFDTNGNIIYVETLNSNSINKINLKDITDGLYFIKIEYDNKIYSQKIIRLAK